MRLSLCCGVDWSLPRQGKHWNLDHPIYKKYRPAATLSGSRWMPFACMRTLAHAAISPSFIIHSSMDAFRVTWIDSPSGADEVMSCIADNCSGTLCLDVDSGPKWQIDCNVCRHLTGVAIAQSCSATSACIQGCTDNEVCNSFPSLRTRRAGYLITQHSLHQFASTRRARN